PLSAMPVLIKSGGIVPARTDYVQDAAQKPLTQLTLSVAAGADGSLPLYQDAGEGSGYQSGQSTITSISWSDASRTLTIGADNGSFSGAATQRSYTLRLSNATAPTAVFVDGVQVPETAWAYNPNQRVTTVVTAALPVSSAHTIALTGSATANPAGGEVIGDGGLCLDVRGAATANGTPLQLYGCNHSGSQQTTYTAANSVQVLGKCLDAANGGTANGTLVQLYDCNGTASQTWIASTNGALLNPQSGRCLDDPNGNTTPGAVQLQLYDCNGSSAQAWKLPPGPITGPGGLCADVAGAYPSYATAVQLYTCNQSDAQRWYAPGDSTIRVFGKCLDVRNGAPANGTQVDLFDCNGTGSQTWVSQSNGALLNPQSGRCLDDPNNNEGSGDLLQIYDCNGSAAKSAGLRRAGACKRPRGAALLVVNVLPIYIDVSQPTRPRPPRMPGTGSAEPGSACQPPTHTSPGGTNWASPNNAVTSARVRGCALTVACFVASASPSMSTSESSALICEIAK